MQGKIKTVLAVLALPAIWALGAKTGKGKLFRWWLVLSLYYSPIAIVQNAVKPTAPKTASVEQASPTPTPSPKPVFSPEAMSKDVLDNAAKLAGAPGWLGGINTDTHVLIRSLGKDLSFVENSFKSFCGYSDGGQNPHSAPYLYQKQLEMGIAEQGVSVSRSEDEISKIASVFMGSAAQYQCPR
ncbi:hypothetical protein NC981_21640 [Leptolyngbya sp. DQ-M1]|uniref:hypothetical protein n=1 Tax=Leptolyngbya sp. DQ-M1 TaxID=2933920 RepID=UPI00329A0F41